MYKFNVKYSDESVPKLQKFNGEGVDLSMFSCKINGNDMTETLQEKGYVVVNEGDTLFVDFGVAIDLTDKSEIDVMYDIDFYADLRSRSSTFKNYGIILTNGVGLIDNAYKGNNDTYKAMFYCTKRAKIEQNARLCQFTVHKCASKFDFVEVDDLQNDSRGGYGSTGK